MFPLLFPDRAAHLRSVLFFILPCSRPFSFLCSPLAFFPPIAPSFTSRIPTHQVAVVLSGRQAGKKVVVVKQYDDGTKERPYPHAIVAGIERYPLKVNKSMGAKRISRRSKVKPFIKVSVLSSFVSRCGSNNRFADLSARFWTLRRLTTTPT